MKIFKSMSFKFFYGFFLVGTIIYVFSAFYLYANISRFYEKRFFSMVKKEVQYIEHGLKDKGLEYLIPLEIDCRITLIHPDGTVYYDSFFPLSHLDNHNDREEVIEARKNGFGYSTRFSKTDKDSNTYVAYKMEDGNILRITESYFDNHAPTMNLFRTRFVMFFITLFLTITISMIMTRKILQPINQIDLDNPTKIEVYKELEPFINKIEQENKNRKDLEQFRREFSANVSHELKTPLTSISGFAELIQTGNMDKQTMQEFAGDIYKESQRLISIVNNVIKLSKLDEKFINLDRTKVNLYDIVTEASKCFSVELDKKNISLEINGGPLYIKAVPHLIHEIVFNLVDNAIKYNKENGKITVLLAKKTNKQVVFSIKDTGIGIPSDEIPRIFERFYRVDKSHSKEIFGTGLGLSIVQNAAAYHNAKIEVSSQIDVGTTISVIFNS